MAIESIECESWEALRETLISRHHAPEGRRLYRGHADSSWRLVPQVHRRWVVGDPALSYERNSKADEIRLTFHRFLVGMPGIDTGSLGRGKQLMAYGRHHGLATAYLDWTRSPFIGAFFAFWDALQKLLPGLATGLRVGVTREELIAVVEASTDSVSIWSLLWPTGKHRSEYRNFPGANDLTLVDDRQDAFFRQKAQQGAFTALESNEEIDQAAYLEANDQGDCLLRIDAPVNICVEALGELRLMNVTYATLFPDPHGAAVQANVDELFHQALAPGAS